MNQVALIEVPLKERVVALGLFVNGHQVMVTGRSSGNDNMPTRHVAQATAKALGVELTNLVSPAGEGESDWCWEEVQIDMINNGHLTPPAGHAELMKGFYRCPSCFEQWTVLDTLNEALLCQKCDHGLVEPYYGSDPSATQEDALYSLADQERQFPNPDERGQYDVEVCRSSTKHANFTIDDATGPATAHFLALEKAGDHTFGSDSSLTYDVNYCHSLQRGEPGGAEGKPLHHYSCLLKVRGSSNDEALAEDSFDATGRAEAREIMIDRHWDERLNITSTPTVVIRASKKKRS